jgi:hypothetical protein
MRRGVKRNRFFSQAYENPVDKAVGIFQYALEYIADHNPGDKIGKKHHGLGSLGKRFNLPLVYEDGEEDRHDGTGNDKEKVEQYRISGNRPGPGRGKEKFEICQSHKGAADAGTEIKTLKGDNHVGQRKVSVYERIDNSRQGKKIEEFVFPQFPKNPFFLNNNHTPLLPGT